MGVEQYNMMLFQTADDAWNAKDVETFANRHTEDVVVYVPAAPTQYGMQAQTERPQLLQGFPGPAGAEQALQGLLRRGDWVCSRALHRHDDGIDDRPRRDRDPSHRQVVRRRLLHRRPLEERADGRGVALLRRRDLHEADRIERIDRTQARNAGPAARTHADRGPGVSEHEGCAAGARFSDQPVTASLDLRPCFLDDARARGDHVRSLCPFVKGWIGNHPEYADPVAD